LERVSPGVAVAVGVAVAAAAQTVDSDVLCKPPAARWATKAVRRLGVTSARGLASRARYTSNEVR
jgi:hypothetical protein